MTQALNLQKGVRMHSSFNYYLPYFPAFPNFSDSLTNFIWISLSTHDHVPLSTYLFIFVSILTAILDLILCIKDLLSILD